MKTPNEAGVDLSVPPSTPDAPSPLPPRRSNIIYYLYTIRSMLQSKAKEKSTQQYALRWLTQLATPGKIHTGKVSNWVGN